MLNRTPLLGSLRFAWLWLGVPRLRAEPPSQLTPLPAHTIRATGGCSDEVNLCLPIDNLRLRVSQDEPEDFLDVGPGRGVQLPTDAALGRWTSDRFTTL